MVWTRLRNALGMADGGALRGLLDSVLCGLGIGDCRANNEVAFTAAVVALSAKMAKADGIASSIEFEAFERVFKPPQEEAHNVRRLFELATRDIAGFESYAKQIAKLLAEEPQLKRDVFEGLFHIAAADGVLHGGEETYLKRVAEIFGYDPETYQCIRALFVRDPDDPYVILGVDPGISNADLKAHYRALVRTHHPDAAIARGVPENLVEMATRKIAALNAAYEQIARERNL